MSNASRVWILGASDPEMQAIETLLRECGERVEYATSDADGLVRVTAANAYRGVTMPAALRSGYHGERVVPAGTTWYQVECDLGGVRPYGDPGVVIDHHRPGDPGYGRPPSEFLAASSIGQVTSELARLGRLPTSWPRSARHAGDIGDLVSDADTEGWGVVVRGSAHGYESEPYSDSELAAQAVVAMIPSDLVLTAAADHCLGAAYHGECPGVDPDALMRWRAESRARFQGRSVEHVLADVERAQRAIERAPYVYLVDDDRCCGAHRHGAYVDYWCCEGRVRMPHVIDMRREGEPIPELPEAATRLGVGYVSGPLECPDGRRKFTCSGSEEQVRAFLEVWAPSQGLVDLYGDPARGFAGGYLR